VGGSFSSAGRFSGDDTAKRRGRGRGFVLSFPLPATTDTSKVAFNNDIVPAVLSAETRGKF